MDGYVTIADFGEWSIVEEYGSERTIQESERILRYCNERERRNRKIEAKRKEEIESNITAALLGAISVMEVIGEVKGVGPALRGKIKEAIEAKFGSIGNGKKAEEQKGTAC